MKKIFFLFVFSFLICEVAVSGVVYEKVSKLQARKIETKNVVEESLYTLDYLKNQKIAWQNRKQAIAQESAELDNKIINIDIMISDLENMGILTYDQALSEEQQEISRIETAIQTNQLEGLVVDESKIITPGVIEDLNQKIQEAIDLNNG